MCGNVGGLCKGEKFASAKQTPIKGMHTDGLVSSPSLLFQYNHITTLPADLSVLTIVHSYLFQL